MLRLTTLGGLSVQASEANLPALSRPRHLALLCVLAATAPAGVTRDKILALLWPELDAEHGRNALNQLLFGLRRDLGGPDVILGRSELRLNPAVLSTDLEDFEAAIRSGDLTLAAELYGGPFADGFHVSGTPPFDEWLEDQRSRLTRRLTGVLEQLALGLEQAGNWHGATKLRWRLAETDPLNSRAALALVRALAAAGDRGGALQFARRHEELLRKEVGTGVDLQMARFVDELLLESRSLPLLSSNVTAVDGAGAPATTGTATVASGGPVPVVRRRLFMPSRWLTRRRSVVLLSAPILALALGALTIAHRPPWRTGEPLSGRTQTVAVLPFTVRGSSAARFMGAGLVELLARNLDGAANIRTVDPRVVLRAAARDSTANTDVSVALRLASRLHATRVILGDVFASGTTVRISASTFDDQSASRPLATATVEGASEDVLALVDQLAARLIASDGNDARQRAFDAGYHSTRSLPALKAYLTGESRRRDGQYADAIEAFEDAIRQDSTFALAYYALSNAADWAGRSDLVYPAALQARRFASRLTDHDRMLVQAYSAWRENRSEEAELLYQRLLHAHPDDAESWYQLGELLFHDNSRRGRTFAESRPAFEKVLALQPDDRESLMHLVRIAARTEGARAVDSLTQIALRVASPEDARELRALRAFALDDSVAERASLREIVAVDVGSLANIAWRVAIFGTRLDGAERIMRLGIRDNHPMMMQADARAPLAWILLGRGQFGSAVEQTVLMERAGARVGTEALLLRAFAVLAPDRPAQAVTARQARAQLDSAIGVQLARRAATDSDYAYDAMGVSGLLSIQIGDLATARRIAAGFEALPLEGTRARHARASALGLRARVNWIEGRKKEALDAMLASRREGVVDMRTEPFDRFFIGEMLSALGRDNEAARWFASISERGLEELTLFAPAERRLALIAERQGNVPATRDHYARFVRLWQDSDRELQPLVEEARIRIMSLATTGARRATGE